MALQMSTVTAGDITLSTAYYKIHDVRMYFRDTNPRAEIVVSMYKDSDARTAEKARVTAVSYTCSGEDFDTYLGTTALNTVDQNVRERAYEYLKTLAEFSGASDV